MSTFNPEEFLNTQVDTSFDTKRTPIPERDDYIAVIGSGEKDVLPRVAKDRVILDITWEILDDALKASLRLPRITVRQSVFLDLDENGKLAKGTNANVQLGRVRDALGQNQPGQAWSPRLLKGAGPAKLKVGQRPDDKDASVIYNDVLAVTKLA